MPEPGGVAQPSDWPPASPHLQDYTTLQSGSSASTMLWLEPTHQPKICMMINLCACLAGVCQIGLLAPGQLLAIVFRSHVGMEGNEMADEFAKIGLKLEPTQVQIPASDAKPIVQKFIRDNWKVPQKLNMLSSGLEARQKSGQSTRMVTGDGSDSLRQSKRQVLQAEEGGGWRAGNAQHQFNSQRGKMRVLVLPITDIEKGFDEDKTAWRNR
ncbi:hypothetical protein EGW08_000164 [Elysia chlorotica]|uniref:RNase H type-1 domain-containing protein n=1 Tax=Elysia chlorotica TaxID=188477 RepID=A0A433UDW1_ELYCH|nr:hypothetical protein EGW08_000164 [Elysia chlorotica]